MGRKPRLGEGPTPIHSCYARFTMSGLDQPRNTGRFVSDRPVPGSFSSGASGCEVFVCDLSVNGAQIEHAQALRPAMRGRLTVGILDAAAVVIWTRMTVPGRYRSGLRLEERLDVVATAIRDLLARGVIHKAGDTQRQRERALIERSAARAQRRADPQQTNLSNAAIQTIHSARKWLLEHPEDAVKWYQRARRIATDAQLQIAGSGRMNREDVLAVWEYLERRVALADVVRALDRQT